MLTTILTNSIPCTRAPSPVECIASESVICSDVELASGALRGAGWEWGTARRIRSEIYGPPPPYTARVLRAPLDSLR